MGKPTAYIVRTASYLPKKIVTNKDLEEKVDTTDEWIVSRTGISERRIAGPMENTSDMGFFAAEKVLAETATAKESIDLILVATLSPDYLFPSTASIIQARLGASNAGAVDIQAACSGMIYALSMAKAYIESGMYQTILVIASEKISAFIDYEDRNTCVLFGDGAAASIVTNKGPGLVLGPVVLGSDGKEGHLLMMPAGGSHTPATEETVKSHKHYLHMDGKELYRHAVRRMETAALQCLEKARLQPSDISYFIPHQANIRIIEALTKRFDIPEDRVVKKIHLYGNTSASSIGITLEALLQTTTLADKDYLLLVAFGAGLTWGAMILQEEKKGE